MGDDPQGEALEDRQAQRRLQADAEGARSEDTDAPARGESQARSIHWSPYDRVRVVNAVS